MMWFQHTVTVCHFLVEENNATKNLLHVRAASHATSCDEIIGKSLLTDFLQKSGRSFLFFCDDFTLFLFFFRLLKGRWFWYHSTGTVVVTLLGIPVNISSIPGSAEVNNANTHSGRP